MEKNYISLAEIQARPLPPGFDTISGPLPHSLLNDLMFRIVFETNQEALKLLLCSLLHLEEEEIVELVITNPIRLGESPKQKLYIYDIYLVLNNRQKVHLELQVVSQDFWVERSLCYLCRDFGDLNAGETYAMVKPHVQIDIIDFDLYENSQEFYATYHLANDKTGRIYSDKLALHVLELNKEEYATEEDKVHRIDYWARLFKATTWEELKMLAEEQKVLQSTVETMYRISADEYVKAELRAREDELRLQRTLDMEMKRRNERIVEQAAEIKRRQEQIERQEATLESQKAKIESQQTEIERQKATLESQQSTIAGYINKEVQQITKKIMAGKSLEQTADELEEAPEAIREQYEKILKEIKNNH